MNAGVVHKNGKVEEKDGGFPYEGGWAVPPLASRQKLAGEHLLQNGPAVEKYSFVTKNHEVRLGVLKHILL